MIKFYIDVPDIVYDSMSWKGYKDSNSLVSNSFGLAKAEFIVNSNAKLSKGDIYEVTLYEDDCEEFFTLRTGLRRISNLDIVLEIDSKWADIQLMDRLYAQGQI